MSLRANVVRVDARAVVTGVADIEALGNGETCESLIHEPMDHVSLAAQERMGISQGVLVPVILPATGPGESYLRPESAISFGVSAVTYSSLASLRRVISYAQPLRCRMAPGPRHNFRLPKLQFFVY